MEEREDFGVRDEIENAFQDRLAAAHPRQPVMDDGHATRLSGDRVVGLPGRFPPDNLITGQPAHRFSFGSGVVASGYSSFAAHASQM